jgi:hypothetical protein
MSEVRYYTTKSLRDGIITFKCIFCEHCVTTQDFDSIKGNRRTQAAAVMNRHAMDLHLPLRQNPPATSGRGGAL